MQVLVSGREQMKNCANLKVSKKESLYGELGQKSVLSK
jgi:hypothetical protein